MEAQSNLIPIFLGLLFFLIGLGVFKSMSPKMEYKKKTKGELVDYIQGYDSKNRTMWAPVYEFDVDGKIYKVHGRVQSSSKRMIKKVATIEYDDCNPNINAIPSERLFAVIFIIIGLFVVCLGVNEYLDVKDAPTTYVDDYKYENQ